MDSTDTMYESSPTEFDPFAGPEISLIAPATESQVEIWTSCLIGGPDANRAYNECFSLLLKGLFVKSAMLRALQELTDMHQSLRMAFSADGKSNCIYKHLHLDVDYQDVSSYSSNEQQNFLKNYNTQIALTVFDLVNGPLFKAALFKLNDREHLLTFTAHHIVCDGWSVGIMMQDLGKLYSAYAQGNTIELPAAPLFSNYAQQQSAFEKNEAYADNEQYWLGQFAGSSHQVNLPIDFPRPALRTYKSTREDLILDGALTTKFKTLAKTNGSSFVTTLLAAFEVFLRQLTGQDEIIIGLPSAGQPATDNFQLVGHCVNLLPLRSQPKGDISFKAYLKQRRSGVLDAYDHQLYTFGSLLKKLNIARDPSRVPLVPIMFNIDMGLDNDVAFYALQHKLISNPRAYENFELFLNIAGHEEAPTLEWSYNTQLFKASTIKNIMDGFEFLLRQVVNNPDMLIGDIPTQNSAKLLLQLEKWNDTGTAYPNQTGLHNLISKQALNNPGKTAVTFGNKKITYQQLNEQANQLAKVLMVHNVTKGDKVAFSLDRSPDMLITMLAIMKAGAVYIPLDPLFPLNRINYMLDDSKAVVLLTSQRYKGRYQSNAKELLIENEWPNLADYPSTNPLVEVDGDDLAYILYTSGSTGMPKGVAVAHHNLVNFLYSMQREPGLTAADKLLAVTTVSFDIAGLELFLPLLTGAEIVIADTATAKDGRALLNIIKDQNITVMQATPYTWRIMLESGWDKSAQIKAICGGEALPAELADRLLNCATSLWNVYGPTETTIWSTVKEIRPGEPITIGRPIDNTSVYILDNFFKPLPPGATGEIYIGGEGVAKGYLNLPELTEEKFIYDPFAKLPGAKMYRTGDLGRFMENGEIACLGRADSQVKIRGYRIETGEIEYQLVNELKLKEAVVLAQPDNIGVDKLIAFVVADSKSTLNITAQVQAWKAALKNVLPEYMIPDNFIILSAMPLTPNGKIDKNVLAKNGHNTTQDYNEYVAPGTDTEKLLADIWAEYLGVTKIGIYDNFFELGGHSLIAVQVMGRIEKETAIRLPLAALFETSTIEKLAKLLEQDVQTITWDSLVPIKPQGNKMPLYMVHGAGLNVLLFNTLAMNMSPEQPVYGLQAKGLNGIEEPLDNIEAIAAHYIQSVMQQNPTGPYALAGYSFGGIIAFEMARQLKSMGKEVKMLAMFDTYAYRSPHYDPRLLKFLKKARFFADKILYNLSFKNGFKDTLSSKGLSMRRKVVKNYWKLRYGKNQKQTGFFGYSNKIDEMNNYAERRYQLKPAEIELEVFRAEQRTFYMDDFENLGWQPYALKGVNIHKIPGEHNTIFKAPNGKVFASVLQKCLDEAIKK